MIFEALNGCHDILILGTSSIKWRQRPDMTLAVDRGAKRQPHKQTYSYIIQLSETYGHTKTSMMFVYGSSWGRVAEGEFGPPPIGVERIRWAACASSQSLVTDHPGTCFRTASVEIEAVV